LRGQISCLVGAKRLFANIDNGQPTNSPKFL